MKFPFLILLLAVLACAVKSPTTTSVSNAATPAAAYSPDASTATPVPTNQDSETEARVLVGLDDGEKVAADPDDIRVKRVRYLLDTLQQKTHETPISMAAATDHASELLESKYGKRVMRQQLLEDMKVFYLMVKGSEKTKFSDALTAQIILQYAN